MGCPNSKFRQKETPFENVSLCHRTAEIQGIEGGASKGLRKGKPLGEACVRTPAPFPPYPAAR